jgi:hypothetical protein
MNDEQDAAVAATFDRRDAFEPVDEGYRVTTAAFEGTVSTTVGDDEKTTYTLTVRAPTLDAATRDYVGSTVSDGWFETLQRRLAEAPKATRVGVELEELGVRVEDDEVLAVFSYVLDDPRTAADVAKTFTEYVEGTYVEGVVPGYDYEGVVANLLGRAASGEGEGDRGGTPL